MAHLTLEQRYEIEMYRKTGKGISVIAIAIGKDKSVVSREINRNSDLRSSIYKAKLAELKTLSRHLINNKARKLNAEVEANISLYLGIT